MGFLTSCVNKSNDSEMYVGAYRSLDQIIPYPYILEQKNDSIFFYNNKGNLLGRKPQKSIIPGDTIKLAGRHFLIGNKGENHFNTFDLNDNLKFEMVGNERTETNVGERCNSCR